MRRSDPSSPDPALKVLLALTRVEPAWREVTVDHGDVRLGGFVIGGVPERMTCINHHPAAEVELPLDELHAESLRGEPPPWLMLRLHTMRRLRAEIARDYLSRLKRAPEAVKHESVDWTDELELARSTDDEKGAAATLHTQLLNRMVAPCMTRIARSVETGGMWAFGLEESGDVVVGSHDVEARRSGQRPTFLWIPAEGGRAFESFLISAMTAISDSEDDRAWGARTTTA